MSLLSLPNHLRFPIRREPEAVPVYCEGCAEEVEEGDQAWCPDCEMCWHQAEFWDLDQERCKDCTCKALVRAEWKLAALRRDDLADRVAAEILEGR